MDKGELSLEFVVWKRACFLSEWNSCILTHRRKAGLGNLDVLRLARSFLLGGPLFLLGKIRLSDSCIAMINIWSAAVVLFPFDGKIICTSTFSQAYFVILRLR
jgi:hypothetical protein